MCLSINLEDSNKRGEWGISTAVVAGRFASVAMGMEFLSAAAGVAVGGFVFAVSLMGYMFVAAVAAGDWVVFGARLTGYISVTAVAAAFGFALTASPFLQTPKKEPKTLAPPWAPRWGSGFPRSGIAPGARRQPAIHGRVAASSASMPSCPLRNACVRPSGGGRKIKSKIKSQSKTERVLRAFVGAGLPANWPISHTSALADAYARLIE